MDAEKDLADLNRARTYAAKELQGELGPGGMFEEFNEDQRDGVQQAISLLGTEIPFVDAMIHLYQWRHPKDEVPE